MNKNIPQRSSEALNRVNTVGRSKEHGSQHGQPNYLVRRVAVLAAGATGIVGAAGMLSNGESVADNNPTETTVVVAQQGDSVWSLQREEATKSGVDPKSDIRDDIDRAVDLNGGSEIQPGQAVVLVDIPNK